MSAFMAETQLMGHQEPRIELLPSVEPDDSYALADAVLAILDRQKEIILDPWQRYVVRESLRLRANGHFAAPKVGLVIGRQQGKSLVIAAIQAALLMLLPGITITHTSQNSTIAEKQFTEVLRILEAFPTPTRKKYSWRATRRTPSAIESKAKGHKSRIIFATRTPSNARGLTADFVFFDEALLLEGRFLSSFLPVMSSKSMQGRTQVWYVSSAGLDTSEILRNIRDDAIAGNDARLAYFEWSAPENSDLDDPEAWAYANPALGRRTSIDSIRDERNAQRGSEAEFARERMGIWDLPEDNSLIPADRWAALVDISSRPAKASKIAIGLDRTVDGRVVSMSIAAEREDGLIHVENVHQRACGEEGDLTWVVAEIKALMRSGRVMSVVLDEKSTINAIVPDLRKAGVPVYVTSTNDMMAACQGFIDLVSFGRLRHIGDISTAVSVASGRKRAIGTSGGWAWNRVNHQSDISPLVSMTLAAWSITANATPKAVKRPIPASVMQNFSWQ